MRYFNQLSLPKKIKLAPASTHEIADLQEKLGFTFPASFREFLELTGNDYDFLFGGGTTSNLRELPYNVDLAKSLLNDREVDIGGSIVPFTSYSDDLFYFFYLDGSDDPAVYRFENELWYRGEEYIPGTSTSGLPRGVVKISNHFSEMMQEFFKELAEKH